MRSTPGQPSEPKPATLSDAVRKRDAGLGFVSRINRWMIAAAVAFAGGLSALTAHAFHAHAATTASSGSVASSSASAQAPAEDPSAGLQAPTSAPAQSLPAPQPVAPVVSGGS